MVAGGRFAEISGEELGYREAAELAVEVGKTMNVGRLPATSLTKVLEEDFGVKIVYREELSGRAASAILMQRCVHGTRNRVEADTLFCVLVCKTLGYGIQATFVIIETEAFPRAMGLSASDPEMVTTQTVCKQTNGGSGNSDTVCTRRQDLLRVVAGCPT